MNTIIGGCQEENSSTVPAQLCVRLNLSMKKTFLFLSILFFGPIVWSKSTSYPKPSKTDCGFYLQLEDQLKCFSEAPYLTHYGYVYCNRFQKELKSWTGKLAAWVPPTTECLQSSLIADPKFLSPCKIMMDHAFGTHPTCYMKSGFCSLAYADKQRVLNVVSWSDVMAEFGESVAQSLRVKSTCDMGIFTAFFHFFDFIFQITRTVDAVTREDAAEILAHVPTDSKQAQTYMSRMYVAILYGSESPSTTDTSTVAKYTTTAQMGNFEHTVNDCKTSEATFCKELRTRNSALFAQESNQKKATSKFIQNTLPERLKAARRLIQKPQAK